jgi:hypothetical protein
MPTPPSSIEQGQSSALAARTKKIYSNDRLLFKFDILVFKTLRMLIEKYFLYYQTLKPSSRVTMEELRFWESRSCLHLPPAC